MIPTLLASAARILYRLIEHHGIDPQWVFREAGLDPALLEDPRARYRVENARAAWREAARQIDNPCFGLQAAEVWRPTDFHALGYAFLASRTLRTAIERVVRYNNVVDTVVSFAATLDDAHLRLTYRNARSDLPDIPALEDGRWAVVIGMCRTAYGAGCDPVEIALTHEAPACRSEYFALFRCPVRFNAPITELLFDRALVERPLSAANRELARANDAILRDYVDQLAADDTISRVKAAILDHLPSGSPGAECIAKDLYMSPRTLQRRLADLGTSYADTLDAVRRELALQYITDPSRPLAEISFLLGFSEHSAFSRAFRRWTGKAPSALRATA